ncbi:MAG TPA: hypothetical protein VFW93_03245 [Aquabacterium sp.]|uniref:hypothetical protein n=1 Tax=Aquabacterium sp. TaxID=1872578 RepID=UPI002E32E6DC|nr:hypothetical protein [Aquabacterium sp.]HEX5355207.1 hypothetical protein [Aquabacterium sp.]
MRIVTGADMPGQAISRECTSGLQGNCACKPSADAGRTSRQFKEGEQADASQLHASTTAN